ncbi:MAG: DUF4143 domain-containing protein [Clostridia bacterium]|nr:DUF4143 domain-containing protein [Clostridia bacterium]
MEPMTLLESGDSNGTVSLEDLFSGKEKEDISGTCEIGLDELAYLVCRGGWPAAVGSPEKAALREAKAYYDNLAETDISTDGVKRNPDRVRMFMRSYARFTGTQAKKPQLALDMKFHDGDTLDLKTMDSYISALKSTYAITELDAWNTGLSTKATVRLARTRHFTDPSIAAAALDLNPDDLINNLDLFSVLFKSMCIRDLRVYARYLGIEIHYYKDSTGMEVDAVLEYAKGMHDVWGAVETDLGAARLDKLAAKLLKFKTRVKMEGGPSFS